jgi:hypothetical protein
MNANQDHSNGIWVHKAAIESKILEYRRVRGIGCGIVVLNISLTYGTKLENRRMIMRISN